MIRILITGANSYIGTTFEKWMDKYPDYRIDTVDMLDGTWRNKDFSGYDAVFHVAGIAHADTGKVDVETQRKYYQVNTDLTIETAEKAKLDGVKQFVFMSSIIVFGSKNDCICETTEPCPDNFYGDSKLKADNGIMKLKDDKFNVVSIRPPMIYGKGSKGNYPRLAKLSRKLPIFPDYDNKRSMLYIENLCEFIRLIITNSESGYFYPQNEQYVKTTEMVKEIAKVYKKKIYTTKIGNLLIRILKKHPLVKKVFGNLYYAKEMSNYKENYCLVEFKESIRRTEG